MLDKVPSELQGLIINKLDPKSKAELKSVSKETDWSEIDVTKPAYTTTGRERTLVEKVKYVTSLCRARTRDECEERKVS